MSQNRNYWDIFRKDVSKVKLERNTSISDNIFKGLKIILYIILFLVVFGGTIVSRASLQILTDKLYLESRKNYTLNLEKDAISYYLLGLISIPDGVQFILSLLQFLVGKRDSPSLIQFIVIIIKECVHCFCLGTLVFKVLPLLNAVEVCAYLSGTPIVPSILKSLPKSKGRLSVGGKRLLIKKLLNILSIILQAGAVFVVPIYKMMYNQISYTDTCFMVLCSICVSVRWFETHFEHLEKFYKKLLVDTENREKYKKLLVDTENREKYKAVTSLVTSFVRLALASALFSTFYSPGVESPWETFSPRSLSNSSQTVAPCLDLSNSTTVQLHNMTIRPCDIPSSGYHGDDWLLNSFLIHFSTSIGLFYGAVISTRLGMDKICFCITLAIGTPVYLIALVVSKFKYETNWISRTLMSKEVNFTEIWIMIVMFFIAWASQLWTCRYIWYSSHDRMALVSRLFVLPHYCSPIADLSLLHSRRHKRIHNSNDRQEDDSGVTNVYICATMWHENRREMKQFIKTLFRLDMDQADRRETKKNGSASDREAAIRDCYEFEAHIMFDDAMETTGGKDGKEQKREPNEFVQQLMEIISEAMMTDYQETTNLTTLVKRVTPYGGRLEWTLRGENKLYVHLKDKLKIRHKKRWSQIMYLYYLIGYKLVNTELQKVKPEKEEDDFRSAPNIFKSFPRSLNQKVENTYVMALDGDVDFSPEALQLLIDRMKKNTLVGATCGRIKPGGSGPVVWYQKFEYAIGHWLQKSAEHVFGCVLCSPGCFSLFRAKALMDDNIMRTYANVPTEPKHYIQYDQGEDRWLCTLLLQQGYRIEYCAAAEALTFAPEDFREFFNQRRRWLPSTIANNLDILMNYKQITKNESISHLYVIYQVILLMSSVLGPSTVLLAMQSAIRTVFSTSAIVAYILTYGPAILFIFICLKFKSQTQLTIAMILSAIYAMLMMAVVVGTIENISEEGFFTQSAVFMYVLVGVFLIAGLFHPHELTDLFWGVLYFICIPAGYLFLIIYAICNLNNVSWGTRETQKAVLECQTQGTHKKKKTEEEFGIVSVEVIEDILKQVKSRKNQDSPCLDLIPSIFQWINNFVILRSLESVVSIFKNTVADDEIVKADGRSLMQKSMGRTMTKFLIHKDKTTDENSWAKAHGTMEKLDQKECNFWIELIDKYLKPLNPDEKKEKAVDESLKNFRNKVAFAFFFVNGLWLVIMTAMNEVKNVLNIRIETVEEFTIIIEPLGLLFIVIFALLLFLQFFGMIRHRYGTFLHLIAATNLRKRKRKGSFSSTEQKNGNRNAQNMGNDETPTIKQNVNQMHPVREEMSRLDSEESV